MLSRKPRHIGPHVIEPTSRRKTVNVMQVSSTPKTEIRGRVWECKYCDWDGLHPSKSFVHIKITRACDGVEWLESELVSFREEYGDD